MCVDLGWVDLDMCYMRLIRGIVGVMRVLCGYYIYGRDSVIIFDMGECGCIKRVIKGVIILY